MKQRSFLFSRCLFVLMLLLAGTMGTMAVTVKLYSSGVSGLGGKVSFSENVLSWTGTRDNVGTFITFEPGVLRKFSKIKFTCSSLTGEGASYRVMVTTKDGENKDVNYLVSLSETGTMEVEIANLIKQDNVSVKMTSEDIDRAYSIRIGGGTSGEPSDGTPHTLTINPATVYLESDWEAPMSINSADDWTVFAKMVKSGMTTLNASLTTDIEVTDGTMIGEGTTSSGASNTRAYEGTFDGGGHTITFTNVETTTQATAPFRFVNGATIKKLHTTGSMSSTMNVMGGIVGFAQGSTKIQDCRSSINLTTSDTSNDATIGGMLGLGDDSPTAITIQNCMYTGHITGDHGISGMVGYLRNGKDATISSVLYAGRTTYTGESNLRNIQRANADPTMTACYYVEAVGNNDQGAQATLTQQISGALAYSLQNGQGEQHWGQARLNASNVDPLPSLTSDAAKKVLSITPQGCGTALYLNAGGAVPNPVRYGALGFRLSGSENNPSLAILGSDITESTRLVRRYDQYALRVTSARATTLVLPFDADIPDGVKAYDLTFDGSTITASAPLAQITANKPVLINAPQGTYIFTVSNSSEITYGTETVTNGALKGVYVQSNKSGEYNPFIYVPEDGYVLQNGDEGLGFYRVDAANKIRITSFRAYLTAPTLSRYLKIVFPDEDVTSVQGVRDVEENQKETIYLLSGVRTNHPVKGLYIKGGKKFSKK